MLIPFNSSSLEISKIISRAFNDLKSVEDQPEKIYNYLSHNNQSVKRTILEQILNFQRLVISFENETKLQSVDKEISLIQEYKHESHVNELESQLKEMAIKYTDSQSEAMKLKAENYTFKAEIEKLNKENVKLKAISCGKFFVL